MSFDSDWFGNCANTFHEEQKQLVYARRMGLLPSWHGAHPPSFNMMGRSVIDIGGGPVSLLLKCTNLGDAVVFDPAEYPEWVVARYEACGVSYFPAPGEDLDRIYAAHTFDEAFIYNVLQHVEDPEKVIANALHVAKTVRIFEWIGIDPYPGHPHRLEKESLEEWFGATGFAANLNENGCVGTAFYGVFRSQKAMTA